MKVRRKDGSIATDSDWAEISFSPLEFLGLAVLAGIGLIAILNFVARHL